MLENNCGKCKWWGRDYQSVCDLIELSGGYTDDHAASIHVNVSDDTGLYVKLVTREDFGCTEFKAK